MRKKEKRVLAFALAMGLAVSAFGGIGISFAKGGISQEDINETMNNGALTELPSSEQLDAEADIKEQKDVPVNEAAMDQEGKVIHKTEYDKSSSNSEDMYNMGEKEIAELMDAGYSAEDVYLVDDLANELLIRPADIIQKMIEGKKSVEEVRQDYLDETNTSTETPDQYQELKDEYSEEYKQLEQKGMEKEDIYLLLTYLKINKVPLTEQLIKEFEENGVEIFNSSSNAASQR